MRSVHRPGSCLHVIKSLCRDAERRQLDAHACKVVPNHSALLLPMCT
jgi:hypothetical protein